MSQQDPHLRTTHYDSTWASALDLVKSTLDIPTVLPPLVKNSWSGLYESKDFMHAIGFPGSNPRSLMRAAHIVALNKEDTPADVERAVAILGVRFSSVIVAINFVSQAALAQRPAEGLWMPLFRDTMTAIEIGYRFGALSSDIGVEGGALMGFSSYAGQMVLLAHDSQRFSEWRSNGCDTNSHLRALELFGCEPYQVGALTLQQLGFGPEIALAAALASGNLHHELVEVVPVVQRWKAAFNWIDAIRRGAPFPADVESCAAFEHLLQPAANGDIPQAQGDTHVPTSHVPTWLTEIALNSSDWMWHLPKDSYEATIRLLSSPRQTTVKGKVWKTSKRQFVFENSKP